MSNNIRYYLTISISTVCSVAQVDFGDNIVMADVIGIDINDIAVLQARPGFAPPDRMSRFYEGRPPLQLFPPPSADSGEARACRGVERGPLACKMALMEEGEPILVFSPFFSSYREPLSSHTLGGG